MEKDLFLFLIPDTFDFADDNSPLLLNWIENNELKANPDKFHFILSEKDTSISIKIADLDIKKNN